MGQAIQEIAPHFTSVQLIGGTARSHPHISAVDIAHNADVLVDFSHPNCLDDNLQACITTKKPLLIGTTGLTDSQNNQIREASHRIPISLAANTCIGIVVLQHLVTLAAQNLDLSYDIEIFETHHRHKIDAPSGTALALGQAASKGRGVPHQIRQSGSRKSSEIGYASHRGGAIFGEHTVRFLGDDDVIELKHTALSRHLFARGALRAALRLVEKSPGLYSISDLFLH